MYMRRNCIESEYPRFYLSLWKNSLEWHDCQPRTKENKRWNTFLLVNWKIREWDGTGTQEHLSWHSFLWMINWCCFSENRKKNVNFSIFFNLFSYVLAHFLALALSIAIAFVDFPAKYLFHIHVSLVLSGYRLADRGSRTWFLRFLNVYIIRLSK